VHSLIDLRRRQTTRRAIRTTVGGVPHAAGLAGVRQMLIGTVAVMPDW